MHNYLYLAVMISGAVLIMLVGYLGIWWMCLQIPSDEPVIRPKKDAEPTPKNGQPAREARAKV